MEVVARATRRNLTNAEKRRILAKVNACTMLGEIGALLRREGVYSSSLSNWRRKLAAGELEALAPQKRGPTVDPALAENRRFEQLTRENLRLQNELRKAMLVIDVQKSFQIARFDSAHRSGGEHLMQGVIELTGLRGPGRCLSTCQSPPPVHHIRVESMLTCDFCHRRSRTAAGLQHSLFEFRALPTMALPTHGFGTCVHCFHCGHNHPLTQQSTQDGVPGRLPCTVQGSGLW